MPFQSQMDRLFIKETYPEAEAQHETNAAHFPFFRKTRKTRTYMDASPLSRLVSPRAGWLNGAALVVDGGQSKAIR